MITPNSPDVISRINEEIDANYPIKKELARKVSITQAQVTRLATNGKYSAELRKKLVAAGLAGRPKKEKAPA